MCQWKNIISTYIKILSWLGDIPLGRWSLRPSVWTSPHFDVLFWGMCYRAGCLIQCQVVHIPCHGGTQAAIHYTWGSLESEECGILRATDCGGTISLWGTWSKKRREYRISLLLFCNVCFVCASRPHDVFVLDKFCNSKHFHKPIQ